MTEIFFTKMNDSVIMPSKNEEDAGYDVYANYPQRRIFIEPNETVMIGTGLKSAFSNDYVAVLKERGSTGTIGMGQRAGIIDAGYRGEWLVPITNHGTKTIVIDKDIEKKTETDNVISYPYSKAICQFLLLPVPKTEVIEISQEKLDEFESIRGEGRLGSSKK